MVEFIAQMNYNIVTTAQRKVLYALSANMLQSEQTRLFPLCRGKPTRMQAGCFACGAGMNNLTETEKAYIAGLIDGEGCITITRYKQKEGVSFNYQATFTMAMTDENIVRTCHEKSGLGYVTFYPSSKRSERLRDQWAWRTNGKETLKLLEQIMPYLILKKPQAELAVEFSRLGKSFNGPRAVSRELSDKRERYFLAMKELKQRDGRREMNSQTLQPKIERAKLQMDLF